MPDARVRLDVADGVATVTLDDPDRRNALDLGLCAEIVTAFDALEARDDVGAVVVTGAPPAFCAGADLSHLGSSRARASSPCTRGSCGSGGVPSRRSRPSTEQRWAPG